MKQSPSWKPISYSSASYPMGTRGSCPGGKVAGAWSWPITSN